jgi:hypothetical protein
MVVSKSSKDRRPLKLFLAFGLLTIVSYVIALIPDYNEGVTAPWASPAYTIAVVSFLLMLTSGTLHIINKFKN